MPQQQEGLEPVNLDDFYIDAEAMGQRAVDAWDPSDLATNRPHLASDSNNNIIDETNLPEPQETTHGYHPAFGYYPLRPAPGFSVPPVLTIPLPDAPFPNNRPFATAPAFGIPPPQPPFVPPSTAPPPGALCTSHN